MADSDFWMTVMDRDGQKASPRRYGAVRVALVFGTLAVAVATLLTPVLAGRTPSARVAWSTDQYDTITTGSIPQRSRNAVYTVRTSILQDSPGALCIIQSNGTESGDC
ncbi:hypothetical protein [Hoeflea olei]|uniref:Uncharacterized protein n=1 Tax=Hoeflea olei TaxID=1480615 RepID=A0A1C1YXW0_9HYPH|nr:hypothetical protein [Hoeflea olei]OCW58305.1 hypothetical protein AWJ14_21700 [Hoeflea olei]